MKIQAPKPSPFIASVVPDEVFDPERHVAFGDVFLERSMSSPADEIKAITQGAGMPDRADQGWISLVGPGAPDEACRLLGMEPGSISPGTGRCRIRVNAIDGLDGPIDLYAGPREVYVGLARIAVSHVLSWF